MRQKKMRYRKRAPLALLFIIVIAVSGVCLAFTSQNADSYEGIDEIRYIASALAGAGEGEAGTEGPETPEVTRSSYDNRDEEQMSEAGKIAAMFISSAISDGREEISDTNEDGLIVSSAVDEQSGEEVPGPVVSDVKGAVFIYHTHSTESYEPYSDGNYHITGNEGTVRNVADELEASLKEKGITVYHDTTLHDSPSYTNSYGRSLQTAKNYLAQYPDIKVVIDLHRDAMSSSGKKYSTVTANGETASSFNIVVGKQNDNYTELMAFANKIITKANELYPGFGGRIIERDYKFNQYLSNYYLLLEVGNNGNTINETEASGRLLADVLEAVMREI